MLAPGDDHDVVPGEEEPSADAAADPPGPIDDVPHRAPSRAIASNPHSAVGQRLPSSTGPDPAEPRWVADDPGVDALSPITGIPDPQEAASLLQAKVAM